MTKKELVERILASGEDLSKVQAERIVDSVFNNVAECLIKDEEVSIAGFGKFSISDRSAREGINPTTKEKISIPASRSAKFKPAKQLKESLNK